MEAHSLVLAASSRKLRSYFSLSESRGPYIIEAPDVPAAIWELFLTFIYTGNPVQIVYLY